ncbi:hypothetical protein Ancab_034414 [Ancistrocladus abbreviatus]
MAIQDTSNSWKSKPMNNIDIFGAALIDCVWAQRNDNIFNGTRFNFTSLYKQLERKWYDWFSGWKEELSATRKVSARSSTMHTMTKDSIIVSFDATMKSTGSLLTCVMQNARNHFILARVKAMASRDPCIAKAQACLEAMWWALSRKADKLFLVSDCKLILDCLSTDLEPSWCARHVINSIVELKNRFKTLVPILVKRFSNLAAHELSQWGMRNRIVCLHDIDILLPVVSSALEKEKASLSTVLSFL